MFSGLSGYCFSQDGRSRQSKENIYLNTLKALVFEVCVNLLICSRELQLQTYHNKGAVCEGREVMKGG